MKKVLKIFKLIFIVFSILLFFLFIFKGSIYRKAFTYHALEDRKEYIITNPDLLSYIEKNTTQADFKSIQGIINVSLSLTANQLTFTTERSSTNPNRLINHPKTNNIGYASFFSSTCNYLLQKHGFTDWKATPKKADLYLFSKEIHSYVNFDLIKNHDFIIIENKKTRQSFAVDPVVYDYSGIKLISYK